MDVSQRLTLMERRLAQLEATLDAARALPAAAGDGAGPPPPIQEATGGAYTHSWHEPPPAPTLVLAPPVAPVPANAEAPPPATAPSRPGPTPQARIATAHPARPATPATAQIPTHTAAWGQATARTTGDDTSSVTRVLGIGGALSIILACVYLVSLAVDSGFFTPERQIVTALAAGVALLATGLTLQNRRYGTYLAVCALTVLQITVVAAHQYHKLIPDGMAVAGIALTVLLAVWLDVAFASGAFAFFAAAGAYAAPLVVPALTRDPQAGVVYFGVCAAAFAAYAYVTGRRPVYLMALYVGMASFAWHFRDEAQWRIVVGFQVLQFVIYGATAAFMSLRLRQPMTDHEAWSHAPALAFFYIIQFGLLRAHAPVAVPFAAAGSAILLVLLHRAAAGAFKHPSRAMQAIVVAYAAVALIHGVYMESVPDRWAPWAGLVAGPAALWLLRRLKDNRTVFGPALAIACIMMVQNNARVLFAATDAIAAGELLRLAFAVQLWSGYWMLRSDSGRMAPMKVLCLYAGHVQALAACVAVLSDRLQVSLAWAALALVTLGIGVALRSREIGRSALLILATAGGKAAFWDLDGDKPLLRVACLAVLGVALFASGWLYDKLKAER